MRIGFFGGTFDPPHCGHLAVARAAADRFELDQVLLAPVGVQPLKANAPSASYADRFAMTRLLCAEDSRFAASAADAPTASNQPNYTIDTLHSLKSALHPADELFVIVGADSFADLHRWKDPRGLLEAAQWVVVSRPGQALNEIVERVAPAELHDRVHALGGVDVPVSATELRRRLSNGEDCSGLLTAPVLDYIGEHGLYRAG